MVANHEGGRHQGGVNLDGPVVTVGWVMLKCAAALLMLTTAMAILR
jgi:hypothetical protein